MDPTDLPGRIAQELARVASEPADSPSAVVWRQGMRLEGDTLPLTAVSLEGGGPDGRTFADADGGSVLKSLRYAVTVIGPNQGARGGWASWTALLEEVRRRLDRPDPLGLLADGVWSVEPGEVTYFDKAALSKTYDLTTLPVTVRTSQARSD